MSSFEATSIRQRLVRVLRGMASAATCRRYLGCSESELLQHLERQFEPGMTWENWPRVWHLDHVRPLASFDLVDPEQRAQAEHC